MKLPYSRPTVFRIKLDYQQAVLAACASNATNTRGNTAMYCRSSNGCRRASSSSGASHGYKS